MPTRPTANPAREQTAERLRAGIRADAPRAAEAIVAAAGRLGVVELLQAAVAIADLTALADVEAGQPEQHLEGR